MLEFKQVACIGTGTMGFSTALSCALKGLNVKIYGRSEASLKRAFTNIRSAVSSLVDEEYLTEQAAIRVEESIKGLTDLKEVCKDADFLIESVSEDLNLKKEMFRLFAEYCPEHTVLGSNTSGLKPTFFSEGNKKADRIIVTHFWNPAHLVPLVEIVPGKFTSDATIKKTKDFLTMIDKKPVLVKREIPGFIGNRLQFALLREALYLLENEVATPEDIDAAVKYSFARRLTITGPIESADLGGLDIFYKISSYLWKDLSNASEPFNNLKDKFEKGYLGIKTGRGYYDWSDDNRKKILKLREEELIRWLKE